MSDTELVCPPDHKHDQTSNCYKSHRCRCVPCRALNRALKDEERRLKAYGRWDRGTVTSWHAATHIYALQRFGYSYEHIARAADISSQTVFRVATGKAVRIRAFVARAILAVTPTLDHLDPSTRIDPRGTRRRIEALGCLGWTLTALAPRLGLSVGALSQRVHGHQVTVDTHRRVAALFDELWCTPPVADVDVPTDYLTRAIRRATRLGWVPALGWDDIDLDDTPPTIDPESGVDTDDDDAAPQVDHEINVAIAVSGGRIQLDRDERLEALKILHRRGYLDGELADLLRVSTRTIERDRKHLGLVANYFAEEHAA